MKIIIKKKIKRILQNALQRDYTNLPQQNNNWITADNASI